MNDFKTNLKVVSRKILYGIADLIASELFSSCVLLGTVLISFIVALSKTGLERQIAGNTFLILLVYSIVFGDKRDMRKENQKLKSQIYDLEDRLFKIECKDSNP